MGDRNIAAEEAAHLAGIGSHSPEVPTAVVSRDASGILVGQVGYRISKYGTSGLDLLFKRLGEYAKSPSLEKYSWLAGRGVGAAIVLVAFFALRGRTARDLTIGGAWEQLTALCDYGEESIRKAIGV